jgi:hypothetical protein
MTRFRHLPVMDDKGAIIGLLDIAKCLYDAISVLEKVSDLDDQSESATSSSATSDAMMAAFKATQKSKGNKGNKAQMEAMMKTLMASMFGGAVPTLRSIIGWLFHGILFFLPFRC